MKKSELKKAKKMLGTMGLTVTGTMVDETGIRGRKKSTEYCMSVVDKYGYNKIYYTTEQIEQQIEQ